MCTWRWIAWSAPSGVIAGLRVVNPLGPHPHVRLEYADGSVVLADGRDTTPSETADLLDAQKTYHDDTLRYGPAEARAVEVASADEEGPCPVCGARHDGSDPLADERAGAPWDEEP